MLNREMHYYRLSSKSRTPESPDKKWLASLPKNTLCRGCNTPVDRSAGIDVHIQGDTDKSALNFVPGIGVGIVSHEFLHSLFPDGVDEYLRLGRVFDSFNQLVHDTATYIGIDQVTIRGGKKSSFRICDECGCVWYSPVGRQYLLRNDVDGKAALDAWFGVLVVAEDVGERIADQKWKNLVVEKLSVLDDPVDGLERKIG